MKENPLHHFELHPLVHLNLLGIDISLNKGIFIMWVGLALVFGMFLLIRKTGLRLVPSKLQSIAEMLLLFLRGLVDDFIGKEERKFFPFVAALFFFILSCNVIGLFPGSYTLTSQLVVTGTFAVFIFLMTLFIGFGRHGLRFLGILLPAGIPKILIPLMIPIEIISMLARPFSLAVRLFANMTAGHTILAVLFGMTLSLPWFLGVLPFGFTVAINGLELMVAFIQAYIFTTLTCFYIGDVIKMH
ncbi:MAG: F0F1 ATP synthase subunit A [Nitrospinae bacterium]|nr:F0F1 ATP synthase subunit A [Nitrospinota bacterium]